MIVLLALLAYLQNFTGWFICSTLYDDVENERSVSKEYRFFRDSGFIDHLFPKVPHFSFSCRLEYSLFPDPTPTPTWNPPLKCNTPPPRTKANPLKYISTVLTTLLE